MPFNLFRRDRPAEGAGRPGGGRAAGPRPVPFDGLSDEWRLAGQMRIEGRLSDALNRRNPIELTEMRWASLVDGGPLSEAPGLKVIDPYDLILVMAGEGSLPPMTEAERAAIKAGQIPEGWAEKPAKLRRKDRDARWTVKFSKARPREDGAPQVDLAVGDVEVAAEDHVPALLSERLDVLEHRIAEVDLVSETGVFALGVRKVGIDQSKLVEIRLKHPALGVDFGNSNSLDHLVGLAAGGAGGIRGVIIYMTIYVVMTIGTWGCVLCMRQHDRMVEKIEDLAGLSRTHPMLALGMGIFMFEADVQMDGSMKAIVIKTQIGPNVIIAQVA